MRLRQGSGWVIICLAVYAALVGVILLAPVSFADVVAAIGETLSRGLGLSWFGSGWIEFGANVLMFAPIGFLLTMLFRRALVGVGIALAISTAAELAQFVIPSREPSPRDILANVAGALLGAGVAWLVSRRRRTARPSADAEAAHTGG